METKIQWESNTNERVKSLVFTAHYDDELLSCGGFIMQNLDIYDFDVVVITHKEDYWRKNFFKVCDGLGVSKAVALNIPLWTNKETKEKYMFSFEEVYDKMSEKGINLYDYGMMLTHGSDGDIDFHPHHKLVYEIAEKFPIMYRLYFNAFPRRGVGSQHQLYDWINEKDYWYDYIVNGFLPGELIDGVNYICRLSSETIKKKRELMDIYMPSNKTYVCIDYPFELFNVGMK